MGACKGFAWDAVPLSLKRRSMKREEIIYGYDAAAEFCGVSSGTIANWIKSGKLAGCYHKISSRKVVFNTQKLELRVFGSL